MKLYKFAFQIISFFSNLNGTIYTQCLAGIKCDEVRIMRLKLVRNKFSIWECFNIEFLTIVLFYKNRNLTPELLCY